MKIKLILIPILFACMNLNAQWTQTTCPAGGAIQCLVVKGSDIFAATQTAGIYLSNDHGATWNAMNNGLTNLNILSLVTDGVNMFAGTNGGGAFLSTNNGANWTAVNNGLTSNIVLSLAIKGSEIFAGTVNSGGVFLSVNNGASWSPVNTGFAGVVNVWSFLVSGTDIYAGTDFGGVYISANDGGNWTLINNGLPNQDIKALAIIGTDLFAAANSGGVFRSTNNGGNWSLANTGISNIYPTSFLVNGSSICAGTINDAFISNNNGNSWTSLNTNHLDVWSMAIDSTTMFLGTYNAGVWIQSLTPIFSAVNETAKNAIQAEIFPDPFHESAIVKFDNREMKNFTLTLFDTEGQTIRTIKNITRAEVNLDRENLANGIYFFRLESDESCMNGKFVVE